MINSTVVECRSDNKLIAWIDLFNSTIIPFTFMLVCSIFLIRYVFSTRLKVKINSTTQEVKRLKKDIQFALTIILLNFDFMLFNLPICIASLLISTEKYLSILDLLFYAQFSCNFIIYLASNKIFREEFLILIGFIKKTKRSTVYRVH